MRPEKNIYGSLLGLLLKLLCLNEHVRVHMNEHVPQFLSKNGNIGNLDISYIAPWKPVMETKTNCSEGERTLDQSEKETMNNNCDSQDQLQL